MFASEFLISGLIQAHYIERASFAAFYKKERHHGAMSGRGSQIFVAID